MTATTATQSGTGREAAPTRPPIAVVGVSALFPGSVDSTGYWNDILSGADRMVDIPETHWLISDHYDPDPNAPDKTYGRRGGFLAPVDFDAMGFGVPPNLVPSTDTAQLLALIVAQRVLDDATTGQFHDLDRNRASVILGVTSGQELFGAMVSRMNRPMWLQGMRRAGIAEADAQEACDRIASLHPEWTEATFPGLLGNVVAGRIANRLDLGGTNCVTDAACASSFSAISMGVNELYLGDSDLVIAGGVDTMNDIFMYMCFSKTPALSKSGDIRPFSAQADGTMLGEGVGMVALKRLEDAERDGNRIYCVLNGVGSSSDGRSKSVYAPVSSGQARALTDAYAKAGYGPDTVELVEAHGTGTVAGDAAEFGGLQLAFDESGRTDRQWCALGSVKSQIGHTKSAAGAAGLIKVVMALHHKVLPQTAKIDEPNPALDLENSPFHLNTRTRPWVRGSEHERRGSVSSFGFGGSNFHIALSEYVGEGERASRLRTDDAELIVVTGSDGVEVRSKAVELAASIAEDRHSGVGSLAHLARSSQSSYTGSEPARLAVVALDLDDLRTQLEAAIDLLGKSPGRPFSVPNGAHFGVGAHEGDIALLFPGQGSQYPEMGIGAASAFSESMRAWDLAADQDWGDTALDEVVFPITRFADGEHAANVERLTATQWAQPAIGAMSMSLLALLRAVGLDARHVGGHSFGEIVALHAADVLTASAAITVARRRGELMAEAARTPGSMTAVTASIDAVEVIVEQSEVDVVIANHNSHRQSVLSGPTEAIERIESALDDAGLRYTRLPVATAFHSSVVASASDAFHEFLHCTEIGTASIPVYANETATRYPSDADEVRSQLARQISHPVRFVDMIEAMYDNGARTFVEVGPSSVLTGLVGNILEGRDHRAVALDKKQGTGVKPLFDGLAKLVAAGVEMNLAALWTEYDGVRDPADVESIKLAVSVDGSNQSPYPPSDLDDLAGPNPVAIDDRTVPAPMPPASTSPTSSPAATTPAHMNPTPLTPTPTTHAPNPTPTGSASVDPSILSAYQDAQHQTALAHTAYLDSMAAAHQAFLTASQQGIAVLGQLASGGAVALPAAQAASAQPQADPAAGAPRLPVSPVAPSIAPTPAPAPAPTPFVDEPVVTAPIVAGPGAGSTGSGEASSSPGRGSLTATESLVSAGVVSEGGVSLVSVLLSVVADRTGYPSEMLSLEMELESDLGIDSIKRVEILSAMQDEVPGLPEVDLSVMAGLATLGEIAEYMTDQVDSTGSGEASSSPGRASLTATESVVSAGVVSEGGVSLVSVLLSVVADRTGYPSEMLSLEMELESDLGIDSIKRVEILSAMQDEVPGLPEVDLSVMAGLATLGEIAEYMTDQVDSAGSGEASSSPGRGSLTATESVVSDRTVDVEAGPLLDRFVVRPEPMGAPGTPLPGLMGAAVSVVGGSELGAALVEALTGHGIDARTADAVSDSSDPTVVYLAPLTDASSIDEAVARNREAFEAFASFGPRADAGGSFVVVIDQQAAFAGRDDVQAWASGVTALARTASLEWPSASIKTIDIDRRERTLDSIAAALAAELVTGGVSSDIGIRSDGMRVALVGSAAEVSPGTLPIGADDVVVVSGGGRGVTATTTIELARTSGADFVLLGRSTLDDEPPHLRGVVGDAALKRAVLDEAAGRDEKLSPNDVGDIVNRVVANREIDATIARIHAVGARARYVAVDVTDADALDSALSTVRSDLGRITAVVHGAGVLADKLIVEKTPEQFARVFDTKVVGLRNLLEATAQDELTMLCLFSSVAARTGNVGQGDYSMANEVLNKVARQEQIRRGRGCIVKSIGWGPWAGGMVTDSLRLHFEAMGVALIDLDIGARAMIAELSDPRRDQVEVVLGGGVVAPAAGRGPKAAAPAAAV